MTIEQEIFQRYQPDFKRLIAAGFQQHGDHYELQQKFFDQQFLAQITVNQSGQVAGDVLDTSTNKSYLPLRAAHLGAFASEVKNQYVQLLKGIAQKSFISEPFASQQANRISQRINELYGDEPEFIFVRFPHTALFREQEFNKWYAVLADLKRDQLVNNDPHAEGDPIGALTIRVTPPQRKKMLKLTGVYPAYGTIKQNWLSIALDDTFDDSTIIKWVQNSYRLLTKPKYWIIPANPKYYDIMHAFDHDQVIEWKQAANIRIGDTVFMYVTSPVKAVIYHCQVIANNIPYDYHDGKLRVDRVMKIKLIQRYTPRQFDLPFLRKNGVTTVRGPRHLTKSVLQALLSNNGKKF